MSLRSPTADFPDMSGFIDTAKARGSALAQAAWANLSTLGGPPPIPATQMAAQMPPQGQGGYSEGMGGWGQGLTNSLMSGASGQQRKFSPKDRIGQLILETAAAAGADPLDLATSMSYETAGTFNPRTKGPTTQWGQHQGFIQFGETQRNQFGVDMSSEEAAIASQLGKDGAVVKYLKAHGFQPGMSGLDLYSTINAGGPGKHGASDANNGGAPGSVADKWNNQMADHRRKAAALLGITL